MHCECANLGNKSVNAWMSDYDCCCIALIIHSYSLFTKHVWEALSVSAMGTAHTKEENVHPQPPN